MGTNQVQASSSMSSIILPVQLSTVPNTFYYDKIASQAIILRALMWVGKCGYATGGCGPINFDCSGLVAYAITGEHRRYFSTGGDPISNFTTYTIQSRHDLFAEINDPLPGDIANYHLGSDDGHCGIVLREGLMVHAVNTTDKVSIGWINTVSFPYRYYRYLGGLW